MQHSGDGIKGALPPAELCVLEQIGDLKCGTTIYELRARTQLREDVLQQALERLKKREYICGNDGTQYCLCEEGKQALDKERELFTEVAEEATKRTRGRPKKEENILPLDPNKAEAQYNEVLRSDPRVIPSGIYGVPVFYKDGKLIMGDHVVAIDQVAEDALDARKDMYILKNSGTVNLPKETDLSRLCSLAVELETVIHKHGYVVVMNFNSNLGEPEQLQVYIRKVTASEQPEPKG